MKAIICLFLLLSTACTASPQAVVVPTLVVLPVQVNACSDWPRYDDALAPVMGQWADYATVMMRTTGDDMASGIPFLEQLRADLDAISVPGCYLPTHDALRAGADWAITGFRRLSMGSVTAIAAFDAANAYWHLAILRSDLPRTTPVLQVAMEAWGGTVAPEAALAALGVDGDRATVDARIQATASALEQAATRIWETYLTPSPGS